MDQQTNTAPAQQRPNQRESNSNSHRSRLHGDEQVERASTSTPTPPTERPSTISSSEPFLRFPQPVGNHHLARWISTSDPDIMRLTTSSTDDTGLSESTYELITGTDSESQDGNYTESMDESVGSLDHGRADDSYSLVGTEHTYDDESVADDSEAQQLTPEADDGSVDDTIRSQAGAIYEDGESEDEAPSRRSIDYTLQSLDTPSIQTPVEGSKIIDNHTSRDEPMDWGAQFENAWNFCLWVGANVRSALSSPDFLRKFSREIILVLTLGLSVTMLDVIFKNYLPSCSFSSRAVPSNTPLVMTGAAAPTSLLSTSTVQTSLATSSVDLIPREDILSDEWLFGKKPVVSFTPQSRGEVLVQVSSDIMRTWLSKGCLIVSATRGSHHVDTIMSSVDDGLLVKFPKKEAHGVVNLSLQATCRPKVQKMVKVHFGKGIMEEAFEMTKQLAHELGELVPVAAHEAERRFEHAKKSLETASDAIGSNWASTSQDVFEKIKSSFSEFHQSLSPFKAEFVKQAEVARQEVVKTTNKVLDLVSDQAAKQATKNLPYLQDAQSKAQLALLDAQVSAKMWWLKVMGRMEERSKYEQKAQEYVNKAQAKAAAASRHRHASAHAKVTSWTSRSWSSILGCGRCQRKTEPVRKSNRKCPHAA